MRFELLKQRTEIWIFFIIVSLSPFFWNQKSAIFNIILGLSLGGVFLFSYLNIRRSLCPFLFLFLLLPGITRFFQMDVSLILPIFWSLALGWSLRGDKVLGVIWNRKIDINRPMVLFLSIISLSAVITLIRYSGLMYDGYFGTTFQVSANNYTNGDAMFLSLMTLLNYAAGPFLFWVMVSLNYKIEEVKGTIVFRHSKVYDRLISGINLGVFLTLLYSAIQWMFPAQKVNGYITGLMTDSNALGASLIIAWPLSVALMIGGHNIFQRVIATFSVILGVLIIFPLGSRIAQGALITNMIIVTSLWLWHERSYIRSHAKIAGITIVSLVLIFSGFIIFTLSFTSENIINTWLLPILGIQRGSGLYHFLNLLFRPDRFPLIVQAVNMTKDYPLSGIGLGTFYFELSNFYRIYVADLSSILAYLDMAHNYYLQISSELGLIGLSLVLWMIVLVIKTIWKGIKIPFTNGDRWLFYGVSSGLISMFLFFIFEALLMFPDVNLIYWFAVGILYTTVSANQGESRLPLNGDNSIVGARQKKREPLFSNKALIVWGVVLAVFTVSLTYSSTHSLSAPSRQRLMGWEYIYGYYPEETWAEGKVRWTGKRSLREIEVKSSVLSIKLFCGHPDVQKMPVQADLWIDNSHVGGVTFFRNGWKDVNIHLSPEKGKKVKLKIEVNRTFNPYKWGINNDRRDLGLASPTEIKWLDKILEG